MNSNGAGSCGWLPESAPRILPASSLNSATRLADIRDGSSHTLFLGERAHGRHRPYYLMIANWWFSSFHGDTFFWSMFPMNPPSELGRNMNQRSPFLGAAGSFHPGGADFAFADGSVRFIKQTISSWPIDESTRMPIGVTGTHETGFQIAVGTRWGGYQALSTRAGGEIVGLDGE